MTDKYKNFEDLSKNEKAEHFYIYQQEGSSGLTVLAPHGGGIEPGTSEIAKGIAGTEHTLYCFEGRKPKGNSALHITSTNIDEPTGVSIAKHSEKVVAIHGCSDKKEVIYLGGLDFDLKSKIHRYLVRTGFRVEEPPTLTLQGNHPNNICNRSKNSRGVQIEISKGIRHLMFEDYTKWKGRERTGPTYEKFVSAIREAIAEIGE